VKVILLGGFFLEGAFAHLSNRFDALFDYAREFFSLC
jgi:hypothetical protein